MSNSVLRNSSPKTQAHITIAALLTAIVQLFGFVSVMAGSKNSFNDYQSVRKLKA